MLILLLGMLRGPSSEFPMLRTLTPRHLGTFITVTAQIIGLIFLLLTGGYRRLATLFARLHLLLLL